MYCINTLYNTYIATFIYIQRTFIDLRGMDIISLDRALHGFPKKRKEEKKMRKPFCLCVNINGAFQKIIKGTAKCIYCNGHDQ